MLSLRRFRLESGSRLLFESALIVLSVTLGLALNEWQRTSADQTLAGRVLADLRAEVEHNLAEVEARLPRRRLMIEAFQSADLSDKTISGWDVILARLKEHGGGIDFPLLQHAAWDAATSTGALRLIDYDVTAALAEIYGAQAQFLRIVDRLYDVYQPAAFEAGRQREVVRMFISMLTELENTEKTLQHTYRSHLPTLQTAASE